MTDVDKMAAHLAEWHTKQARHHWLEAKFWAEFSGITPTVLDTLELDVPEWINNQSKETQ